MSKVPDRLDTVKYAQGLLPPIFNGKTVWNKVIKVLATPFQAIENALFDLLLLRALSTASGRQLDILGEILKAPRRGASDTRYKLRLAARVLILKSSGTRPQLLAIAQQLFPGLYEYRDLFPASWVIESHTATPDDEGEEVGAALLEAKAAGVQGAIIFSQVDDAHSFRFASGSSVEAGTTDGFDTGDFANLIQ